jgi:hypothetical protein
MPLNNEVWSTANLTHWEKHQAPSFASRSAFGMTVQSRWILANITDSRQRLFEYDKYKPKAFELTKHLKANNNVSSFMEDRHYTLFQTMYISGGWDGAPWNDVWATTDGEEWFELESHAIWEERGAVAEYSW